MYNLLIALAAGAASVLLVRLLGFSVWAGLVPGVLVLLGTFVLLARRISQKLQVLIGQAQKELQGASGNPKDRAQRIDKAVKLLEAGLVYERWQILVGPELHGQIGTIKYLAKDFEGAQAHFAQANPRNGMAMALQAALYFQKKDYAKMETAFEAAVKHAKKERVIWAAYAWCTLQLKDKEKALKIMARAVQNNPSDESLKGSLTALQNDKKMKMKPYEPEWWQFGLEQPPVQMAPGGGRRVRFERR